MRKARILVVDGDQAMRRSLVGRLGSANYTVEAVDDAQSALDACVRSRPNLVVTDLRLGEMDGMALLKELKSRWPEMVVIILTAHGTISTAVQATQCGAFGFLVKPVEKAELLGQVARGIEVSNFTLAEGNWRSDIVSRSQLMDDRLAVANKAAGSDAAVLLTGQNGTGKELLARAIHAASARRGLPFVAVSCRNADPAALELELFGARAGEGGANHGVRAGALVLARGGTLLLDEISELPVALQFSLSKALRDAGISSSVGDNPGRSELRLICTTSRDLKPLIESGEFRQDLYYEINVLPIELPPLGRRREDIPLLVSHFLEQATEPNGHKKIYTPKAIELLSTADWPGNVRQLFDLVKRNVALSQGAVITEEVVQEALGADSKLPTYEEARHEFARDYLVNNLQSTAGNVSESARLAKRNRTDFYKLLARYRLQPESFKNPVADAPTRTKSTALSADPPAKHADPP